MLDAKYIPHTLMVIFLVICLALGWLYSLATGLPYLLAVAMITDTLIGSAFLFAFMFL